MIPALVYFMFALILKFYVQVDRTGKALVEILGKDTPDGQGVEKEVAETVKTFKELKQKLQDVVEKCDQEIAQAKVFSDSVSELEDWIETAEDARVLREPVARRPESIRKQLNEIEVIIYGHSCGGSTHCVVGCGVTHGVWRSVVWYGKAYMI
jgi:hypothetical protein